MVVPLRYRPDGTGEEELSFISITAMVGTPMDVTVEELAIESFYPADETTAAALGARPAPDRRDVRPAQPAGAQQLKDLLTERSVVRAHRVACCPPRIAG